MVHLKNVVRGDDWLAGWLARLDPRHAPDARSGPAVGPAGQRDGDLALALDEPLADARRYQLLLRLGLVNLVAFALLGGAITQGWIAAILAADTTHLSVAIFAVFVAGLGFGARKAWQTSRDLNAARATVPPAFSLSAQYVAAVTGRSAGARAIAGGTLRAKLASRIAVVRQIAGALVLLGLVGTVIGFIISLSGVDSTAAGDVSAVAPMVSALIEGMSVALYTTLVGAVLNIWLMVNYNLLARGSIKLHAAIIERGERHARI